MNFYKKPALMLATGFFVGKIPLAPGTFGSVLGIPICFFLAKIDLGIAFLAVIVFVIFAIIIANIAEKLLQDKDPGCIVIDEIAGMMVTLLGLPFNMVSVIFGFLIFRLLDITKPFPIRLIEKKLSGGTAVVMDDIAAGIIGNLFLRLIFQIKGFA